MTAAGDRRDDQTWVALELTRTGENALEDGTLCPRLQSDLGVTADWPLFVPAATYTRMGRRITLHLMEGYVFVGAGLPETTYFALENNCPLVRQVLSVPGPRGLRVLSTIPNRDIEGMRCQLRAQIATDISEEMHVRVTEGTFAPLEGRVLYVDTEDAHVLIELRSIKIIKLIPRVFLEPVDKVPGDE
jgi:transcription antitermination factor NusG